MLLQPAIGHEAAVARESFGLRQIGGRSSLVRVTEDEFTRLERRAGARGQHLATAFNDGLRESIAIAEVVVRIDEWRYGRQVKRREHVHVAALRDEFVVLRHASLALRFIAGEKDNDGVQSRARQATYPVVWMVCSCVAEHLRAGHHTLPELFRERGQRSLVNTQCTQAIPSERHGHPALFLFDRSTYLRGRLNLLPDRRQPRPSARRISKREEFVSPRQRWHSHQQDVLNVIEFKHGIYSEVAGKVLA